jgi:SAM-dependent methyltransferase
MLEDDKAAEYERYNERAKLLVDAGMVEVKSLFGADLVPLCYRSPYHCYERILAANLSPATHVLEIGSGMGMHTGSLLATGASVVATDISEHSLRVLENKYKSSGNLTTHLADMESLPFDDATFDFVASAGSLSYGDTQVVLEEIFRVLKPGGVFVCVDSFSHNPIYRLNRWIHYLKGERTWSTLTRMPRMNSLRLYESRFGYAEFSYFGSICWTAPLLVKIFGDVRSAAIIDRLDRALGVKYSAFKFVMLARKINSE